MASSAVVEGGVHTLLNVDVFASVGGSSKEAGELAELGVPMTAAAWFRSSSGSHAQAMELSAVGVNLWDAGRLLRAGCSVEKVLELSRDGADLYEVATQSVPCPRAA